MVSIQSRRMKLRMPGSSSRTVRAAVRLAAVERRSVPMPSENRAAAMRE